MFINVHTDYYHTKASSPQNKLIENATLKSRVKSPKQLTAPSKNSSLGFSVILSTPGLYPMSKAATWLATYEITTAICLLFITNFL